MRIDLDKLIKDIADRHIKRFENLLEGLKCCGNCKKYKPGFPPQNHCEVWEFDEESAAKRMKNR
jgi:hypothetical protein